MKKCLKCGLEYSDSISWCEQCDTKLSDFGASVKSNSQQPTNSYFDRTEQLSNNSQQPKTYYSGEKSVDEKKRSLIFLWVGIIFAILGVVSFFAFASSYRHVNGEDVVALISGIILFVFCFAIYSHLKNQEKMLENQNRILTMLNKISYKSK